ncbi:hypothetical protein AURDEDRAFT_176513 [Auricularia subglabra TFB-10046 SS5]|uniref:Uncharacterized protein n=1 Tax=Auricularia subglabra (strain TFB-10046 / SS5) TaxID=717982 RepID=J0WPS1_AURST|nr:hypothetical protein AURDEDRAFT_176513 [Auricularia subglabra TFB-10046 SS5]
MVLRAAPVSPPCDNVDIQEAEWRALSTREDLFDRLLTLYGGTRLRLVHFLERWIRLDMYNNTPQTRTVEAELRKRVVAALETYESTCDTQERPRAALKDSVVKYVQIWARSIPPQQSLTDEEWVWPRLERSQAATLRWDAWFRPPAHDVQRDAQIARLHYLEGLTATVPRAGRSPLARLVSSTPSSVLVAASPVRCLGGAGPPSYHEAAVVPRVHAYRPAPQVNVPTLASLRERRHHPYRDYKRIINPDARQPGAPRVASPRVAWTSLGRDRERDWPVSQASRDRDEAWAKRNASAYENKMPNSRSDVDVSRSVRDGELAEETDRLARLQDRDLALRKV